MTETITEIQIYILLSILSNINITVSMPYLSSNIPSSIFYGSIFLEFLQIARCALRLTDFIIASEGMDCPGSINEYNASED